MVLPTGDIYSLVLEIDGYAGQMIALAVAIGLVKLRVERPDLKRPFKAWLPAVFLRVALSCALLAAPFFRPPGETATYAVVGLSM